MATLYAVLCAIQEQVSAVTQGLISNTVDTAGKPLTVEVGLYWPSSKALQNNVRSGNAPGGSGPSALVTVYDRGLAADSTRWLPQIVGQTLTPATITSTLSAKSIPGYGSATLTIGGPLTLGDAVSLIVTPILFGDCAVIPSVVAGDTPATMAARMAALINANGDIGTAKIASLISATSSGPVVTITSITAQSISLASYVGNGGTRFTEVGRRRRHFQIVIWARSPDDRTTVADPIEGLIAQLEAGFGLTFPDGTMGRLTFTGDTQHDEATLSDTMRRDFMVCVDYGINVSDVLYSVLAPIVQNTAF